MPRVFRYNFSEVRKIVVKSGCCVKCGKHAHRRHKFWQTINPFNKNSDGSLKTREDIMRELEIASARWKDAPIFHARCE